MKEPAKTLTETGTVLRVAAGRAWVRLARKQACSTCKGCAVGAEGVYMIAEALDPLGVSVNDEVRIRPAKAVAPQKAALLLYGMPILLFFAGLAAGQAASRGWALGSAREIPGVLAGFLAMALGFIGLYLASRRRRGGIGAFRIVEIVPRAVLPTPVLRLNQS